MIQLTRLNHSVIYLNPDLMKSIEETPDTIIALINGDRYIVIEKAPEIISKIITFRQTIVDRSARPDELVSTAPFADEE
jgi:flagellar protein FlbD